jgi:quercetin dioxygenase-like cupin family protein
LIRAFDRRDGDCEAGERLAREEQSLRIEGVPFMTTGWSTVQPTEHPGASGMALWRTVEAGNIRVRLVEYSAGYEADHWCRRGHVLLVLEGELVTELDDGTKVTLTPGMSYQVADNAGAHKSCTGTGAKLFIVD